MWKCPARRAGSAAVTIITACVLLLATSLMGAAAEKVVLTIRGPGDAPAVTFTEADIRALPPVTFTTRDPWDKRDRTYTGCGLGELLNRAGRSRGLKLIEIIARNDYRAEIKAAELKAYLYMLSYEMDGHDYSLLGDEDKGPLAVAVRMEDVEQGDRLRVKDQLVWWVTTIIVK